MEWFLDNTVSDPAQMLRSIADYVQRYRLVDQERPEVTVFLTSGGSVSGRVVRRDSERQMDVVLLKQGEDSDPALVYLRLGDVTALQIRYASSVQAIFSPPAGVRTGSAPTRLQIKRQIEKIGSDLKSTGRTLAVDCVWPDADESEEMRFGLAEWAQALDQALQKIAGDALGSAALGTVASIRIAHKAGAALEASRHEKAIDIQADVKRPASKNLAEQLVKSIESVLEA